MGLYRVTFDFVPKVVILIHKTTSVSGTTWIGQPGDIDSYGRKGQNSRYFTLVGETLSWYTERDAREQLNESGIEYFYSAVG